MKKLILLSAVIGIAFFQTGCNNDFTQKWEPFKAEIALPQIKKIRPSNRLIKTPCAIEINCPREITAEYGSSNFFYPLDAILENTFNDVRDKVLDSPRYGINSFKLIVDVQEASMEVKTNMFNNGGSAEFCLNLVCRFYDPSEKRVLGTNIVSKKNLPLDQKRKDYVFDSVYEACKESALETFRIILKDERCVNALKRFER